MTIERHSKTSYYAHPIPTIDQDQLLVVTGAGEDEDGNEVVTVAIVAGPVQFEINLSREDAQNLADDLTAQVGEED
ncbi:hypothetical protein RAJCM14343_1221 [Rhodococcus aetherivorans]|uniref:Uncharacterized protein n=1 Tax=Rhodococcus aetherivorans TaxID=191292 RepID=A0ABQ0YHL8_9NOCA|nr:hypothetical protein [Rhodococcus aetherivorans]ETT24967.1 hypothetical protein RR21198_4195 [Rhodococcus rhodochrous ATCC 21198]NGP29537.1 hypothetical protein [Rhodococcus aetherivorans]GES35972.1 hypothetical protein RAJCM14343_1221 [Rhodococcus aetherivorans]